MKSACFLCFLFVLSAQFTNYTEAYPDLMKTAPIVIYYIISNLSYLFFEAAYYLVIGILNLDSWAVHLASLFVQAISIGFMIWGQIIVKDQAFQNFKAESENDKVKYDLVMAVAQMADIRLIYIIILLIFKLMWLSMPYF